MVLRPHEFQLKYTKKRGILIAYPMFQAFALPTH